MTTSCATPTRIIYARYETGTIHPVYTPPDDNTYANHILDVRNDDGSSDYYEYVGTLIETREWMVRSGFDENRRRPPRFDYEQ